MADQRYVVRVAHLEVSARGKQLLRNVTFDCQGGELTLLYGQTGSGKSTLLRAINGLCLPTRGSIAVLGTLIPGRSRREARAVWRQTGTVLQEIALFETKTALANVMLALRAVGFSRASARHLATEWLERLNLGHKLNEYPAQLSGGERQRVALARAFAIQPRLLILDEPTSALDRTTAGLVLAALKERLDCGATVIMSSHRPDEVAAICTQRIALQNGAVLADEHLPLAPQHSHSVQQPNADQEQAPGDQLRGWETQAQP